MLIWVGITGFLLALMLSVLATPVARTLAQRLGMMDIPQRHKMHNRAVPLLGGCAILVAVLMPAAGTMAIVRFWAANPAEIPSWVPLGLRIHLGGAAAMAPMGVVMLGGALLLHAIGLVDDRRNLGPWTKLAAEVLICLAVVLICRKARALTVLGGALSVIVSVTWLVAMTNAFNFLDNMDGLSAGVAAICAAALLGASAGMGQVFVSFWLCLLLGALVGFLPYNYSPASIFMGDAGLLVIGYMLGLLSIMTTYTAPGQTYYLYGIFVPVVLMAVPLYDMVSVIVLRLRDRRNPMLGDRRHFSHRLAHRGMNVRMAVLTVYLCTGGTAIAATLLPRMAHDNVGAILVFCQTLAILLIVAVLEAGDSKS